MPQGRGWTLSNWTLSKKMGKPFYATAIKWVRKSCTTAARRYLPVHGLPTMLQSGLGIEAPLTFCPLGTSHVVSFGSKYRKSASSEKSTPEQKNQAGRNHCAGVFFREQALVHNVTLLPRHAPSSRGAVSPMCPE